LRLTLKDVSKLAFGQRTGFLGNVGFFVDGSAAVDLIS